jgi:hypothetical protein
MAMPGVERECPRKSISRHVALVTCSDLPDGRLQPSKIHETMPLQISLTAIGELDSDV